jgi:hypothetical protein
MFGIGIYEYLLTINSEKNLKTCHAFLNLEIRIIGQKPSKQNQRWLQSISVACLIGDPFHDIEGEGTNLLDGVDSDLILEATLPPLLHQVVVDLTCTPRT